MPRRVKKELEGIHGAAAGRAQTLHQARTEDPRERLPQDRTDVEVDFE